MRAFVRTLARFAGRCVLWLGWLALLVLGLLWAVEQSGLLTSWTREIIASRAGTLGADIALGHARLRWFEPAIELDGLTLGEHGGDLRLAHTRVTFEAFNGRGVRLSSVEIDGGELRIAPALINGLKGFAREMAQQGELRQRADALPLIRVRGLQVDLVTRAWGRLPLGRVDAQLASDDAGLHVLSGRMIPSFVANAGGSGEIRISGQEARAGPFEVHASATELPLSFELLPEGTELEVFRPYHPRGVLALEVEGSFSRDAQSLSRASGRLALTDGSFRTADGQRSFDQLHLDVQANYAPPDLNEPWSVPAWQTRAHLEGRFESAPFQASGVFGTRAGPDAVAKTWFHLPSVPLTHALLELFGTSADNEERWHAFDPQGQGEVWGAIRLPRTFQPSERIAEQLQFGVELALDGKAGLTYNGWRNRDTGRLDMGFPLPLEQIEGQVVFALEPKRRRPAMVGLVGLKGNGGSSIIHANGLITSPPVDAPAHLPGHRMAELDLQLETDRLPVDDRLRTALNGLAGALHPGDSWEPFHPADGAVGVDLRLVRRPEMRYLSTDLDLTLDDVSLAWSGLPIPVAHTQGKLSFRSDGRMEAGLALELEGALRTAQRLGLALRFQTDPGANRPPEQKRLDEISDIAIQVDHAALTGDDRKILVAQFPDIGAGMDLVSPKGFVDLRYRRVHAGPKAAITTVAEVTPLEPVQLKYEGFPMITSDVRGRVLVVETDTLVAPLNGSAGPPESLRSIETRLMPLVGTWGNDVQVAFMASFPGDAVHIYGAGIEPANKSLLGSLSKAIQTPGEVAGLDLSSLSVDGRIDLRAQLQLGQDVAQGTRNTYRLFLRDNGLRIGNFQLDSLHGVLELRDKTLYGDGLDARLARTPVALSAVRFSPTANGFRFETRLSAKNVPLDREHLSSFLDKDTLDALLGELHWRGRLDIDDGKVELVSPAQGENRLTFSGKLTPNDMFVQLGLPMSVRSASASIDQLILEGGLVRAKGRISDLFGEIAGRDLGPADLLFTYVEPRLSIENLKGALEGGSILPLGEGAARGGTVFSIDLQDPFPFQLALDLRSVEVAGLLRGLFPANIATRGRLDAQLRLTGNTEDLLGIQGSGSILVRESRLWTVPVFRALFSQLGFDNTAVFDRMATNLRVHNGVIEMNDIAVHSPLLQLVGEGTLDFDGGLKHELEVRYDLIDQLGPLRRLFYAIQSKLLSVAIRGDMARPEVILKSPLTQWLRRLDAQSRALPLPGFAPLPARF